MTTEYQKTDSQLRPPITVHSGEGAEALLAYHQAQSQRTPAEASDMEQKRLSWYFDGLSQTITRSLEHKPSIFTWWRKPAIPAHRDVLRQPEKLREIFKVAGERPGQVILSEVAIVPESAFEDPRLAEMKKSKIIYMEAGIKHAPYNLGFMQSLIYEQKDPDRPLAHVGSISYPVLALDPDHMDAISPYGSEDLLKALQVIFSSRNHDWIHHLTNIGVVDDISMTTGLKPPHYSESLLQAVNKHTLYTSENDPRGYESLMTLTHAEIWRQAPEEARKNLNDHIDEYFDQLTRIRDQLAKDPTKSLSDVHRHIDYFSTVCLCALMPLLPLNDPSIQKTLDRMQEVDPAPEMFVYEPRTFKGSEYKQEDRHKKALANYSKAGLDLKAARSGTPDYKEGKMLYTIDYLPHVALLLSPSRPLTDLRKAQGRVGRVMGDILESYVKHDMK